MNTINKLFRARIGFPQDETVTFDRLHEILEKTAKTIPRKFMYYEKQLKRYNERKC